MNGCSNKNCVVVNRFMTSAKHCGGFMFIVAASSVAVVGSGMVGLSLCTFWDERQKGDHVKQRRVYVGQLEKALHQPPGPN